MKEIQMSRNRTGFAAMLLVLAMSGCSDSNDLRHDVGAQHLALQPLPPIEIDGKIGEIRTLPRHVVARLHLGKNNSTQQEFVYEAPPGWIIYSYEVHEISKGGDSWYAPQLTSANANYVSESRFNDAMTQLERAALEYRNFKAKAEIENARKTVSGWYYKFSSANNALHIKWGGRSHEVKAGFIPIVIDTKTARLNLDITITIARTVSNAELDVLVPALKQRIRRGESLAGYFERLT
jgi:hypothetical protein